MCINEHEDMPSVYIRCIVNHPCQLVDLDLTRKEEEWEGVRSIRLRITSMKPVSNLSSRSSCDGSCGCLVSRELY